MELELQKVQIKDVQFGKSTHVDSNTLFINKKEMLAALADPLFIELEISLARPGESVRIIPVKDVLKI